MSSSIDYQSRIHPPSEYEHAYEQERGRWLRRRLLWYSGVSLGFGLFASAIALLFKAEGPSRSDLVSLLVSNAAAACVLVLAWRCRPRAQAVLRIAFLFYVLASLWSIGYSYFTFIDKSAELQSGFAEGFNSARKEPRVPLDATGGATQSSTQPASRPSFIEGDLSKDDEPLTINLGQTQIHTSGAELRDNLLHGFVYSTLLSSFFFNHLIVCLFIPWTVRESIRPAGIIAGAAIGVMAINVLFGVAAWWLLVATMLVLPFTFLPGTLVCWWRYSRFNKRFRMQFESGRYRVLQEELNSAREVHDASLPAPRLDGPVRMNFTYEPMRQIGGDLLMIHPAEASQPMRYAILFDVTGHGVAAALSVNRILGEIERLLAENPDESVEDLASALNRYVHLTLAKHHLYVSALLFKIDHVAGVAHCVNAGHPTAYHVDAETRSIRAIDSTSMLLGVVGSDDFHAQSVTLGLAPGDVIVGYTDGASEATNPDGRMLGLVGVRDLLERTITEVANPADWPSHVSSMVIEHRLAPPQDDTIIFTFWRPI